MSKKYERWHKGFTHKGEPLYNREDFVYYFEHRLHEVVHDEIEGLFRKFFFGAPF